MLLLLRQVLIPYFPLPPLRWCEIAREISSMPGTCKSVSARMLTFSPPAGSLLFHHLSVCMCSSRPPSSFPTLRRKPYKCDVAADCGATFAWRSGMINHLRTHHAVAASAGRRVVINNRPTRQEAGGSTRRGNRGGRGGSSSTGSGGSVQSAAAAAAAVAEGVVVLAGEVGGGDAHGGGGVSFAGTGGATPSSSPYIGRVPASPAPTLAAAAIKMALPSPPITPPVTASLPSNIASCAMQPATPARVIPRAASPLLAELALSPVLLRSGSHASLSHPVTSAAGGPASTLASEAVAQTPVEVVVAAFAAAPALLASLVALEEKAALTSLPIPAALVDIKPGGGWLASNTSALKGRAGEPAAGVLAESLKLPLTTPLPPRAVVNAPPPPPLLLDGPLTCLSSVDGDCHRDDLLPLSPLTPAEVSGELGQWPPPLSGARPSTGRDGTAAAVVATAVTAWATPSAVHMAGSLLLPPPPPLGAIGCDADGAHIPTANHSAAASTGRNFGVSGETRHPPLPPADWLVPELDLELLDDMDVGDASVALLPRLPTPPSCLADLCSEPGRGRRVGSGSPSGAGSSAVGGRDEPGGNAAALAEATANTSGGGVKVSRGFGGGGGGAEGGTGEGSGLKSTTTSVGGSLFRTHYGNLPPFDRAVAVLLAQAAEEDDGVAPCLPGHLALL